jgi:cellulose synthase operon protein C
MPVKRGRWKPLAGIALCLVVAGTGVVAVPRAWRSDFVARRRSAFQLKRAQAQLASGRLGEARAGFRAALRLRPFDAEARRQLAAMELSQGNWEIAFLEDQALTELHPEDGGAWMALADLMAKQGWLEAPETALDRAIEAAPQRADARARRGEIRFRLGRYSGARADAEAALAASPGDAAAWALLVRSVARAEGAAAGIETATRAVAAAGRDRALLFPLARLLDDAGRTGEAVQILEETAGALDEARRGKLTLARAKLKAGNQRAAHGQVAALTEGELGPPHALPRRLRADAQTDLGRLGAWTREHWPGRLGAVREELEARLVERNWTEAQRIVESAARTWPESSFAPFLAGTLDLARGQAEEAAKRFTEAVAASPRFPTLIAALGRAWAFRRGASFAGDQLMQLAERDPGLASARYMAARAYVEARDPIKAETALRRGLQLQPDSPVPYQHLTDYYFGLDRTAEALGICQEGLERFPQAADLQLMLAQIDAGLGRTADAVRLYDDLLSRRPDLDLARYKLAVLLAPQDQAALRQRFLAIAHELRNDMPSDPLLADALGWVQLKAGNAPRARELLAAAVKGAPEEPAPHFHLGALHAQERKQALARGELKLALDSPRPFAERLEAMRLLRDSQPPSAAKGNAGVTSARH